MKKFIDERTTKYRIKFKIIDKRIMDKINFYKTFDEY